MTARRTLLTAATAGTLLGALWFVPSAKATASPATADAVSRHAAAPSTVTAADARPADTDADTDTTPYVAGGTAFLGLGAGFVLYSVRGYAVRGYSVRGKSLGKANR